MTAKDLTGAKFGRWTVLGIASTRTTRTGQKQKYLVCRCECGTKKEVQYGHLRSGRTISCGCWKKESAALQKRVHGGRHTPIYEVWTQMLQRCENQNNKGFHRYGGRGITVCERWHDFANFQADNAAQYAPGLTIDREDNDGNYEPGNVRWVPNKVNSRNQQRTIRVDWGGALVPLNELAEAHGVKLLTAYARYRIKGWTVRQALGLDAPPPVVRKPISEETRKRMSAARAAHWHMRCAA